MGEPERRTECRAVLPERTVVRGEPTPAPQPAPAELRLFGGRTLLSLGIALAVLVGLATLVDFRAVGQEIAKCDKGLVLLGITCHYATYWFRGARWRRSLRHLQGKHGYWSFALIVFFYNFVDNVVPAKLGDVYGAHLAQINLGVPRPAALGSIVLQRVIDAWVVLLLAGLSSSLVFADSLPDTVVWSLVLGGIIAGGASLVLLTFAVAHKLPERFVPQAVRTRIASFHTGMLPRPREFLTILLLTAIIWALETAWLLLLALAFGIPLGVAEVVFLTMIPLIASTFPLTPSGAGVVELSLFGCLRALGVASPMAISITVLNRFLDFWLHIALGLGVWALRGRLGLRTWREPLEVREEVPADAGGCGRSD